MFISLFQCLPSSEQLTVWTDVLPPGPPQIVSLTCQSGSTMFLRWVRPEMFHRTVDVYTVSTGTSQAPLLNMTMRIELETNLREV